MIQFENGPTGPMFSQGSAVLGSAEAHFDSRMGATKPREAATLGLAGGVDAYGLLS